MVHARKRKGQPERRHGRRVQAIGAAHDERPDSHHGDGWCVALAGAAVPPARRLGGPRADAHPPRDV